VAQKERLIFWEMKVSIVVIEKNSSYEHLCYSEWVPGKRGLFESANSNSVVNGKK
jgi:hypothetical protein